MSKFSTVQDIKDYCEIDPTTGCWEWQLSCSAQGYGQVRYDHTTWTVHRIVLLFSGVDIEGYCVCHHCDNPKCCNPDHLFLGTQADNIRDSIEKGRFNRNVKKGGESTRSLLTEKQVREIRERVSKGELQCKLAEEFGVHRTTVGHICSYRTWGHVE